LVKLADSLRSESFVHYLGGDNEKALKALDESIELHDGDPGAFLERGRLHQELGNQIAYRLAIPLNTYRKSAKTKRESGRIAVGHAANI